MPLIPRAPDRTPRHEAEQPSDRGGAKDHEQENEERPLEPARAESRGQRVPHEHRRERTREPHAHEPRHVGDDDAAGRVEVVHEGRESRVGIRGSA